MAEVKLQRRKLRRSKHYVAGGGGRGLRGVMIDFRPGKRPQSDVIGDVPFGDDELLAGRVHDVNRRRECLAGGGDDVRGFDVDVRERQVPFTRRSRRGRIRRSPCADFDIGQLTRPRFGGDRWRRRRRDLGDDRRGGDHHEESDGTRVTHRSPGQTALRGV